MPTTRRERKATPRSAEDIPLSQPDYSAPTTRTLYDIAAERQAQLASGIKTSRPMKSGDGLDRDALGRPIIPPLAQDANIRTTDGMSRPRHADIVTDRGVEAEADASPIGPLGESIFLTLTLSMLHFTLSLLVHNQYASSRPERLWPFARGSLSVAPVLGVFVYLLKCPMLLSLDRRWGRGVLKQGLHWVMGTGAGCYMIWIGNKGGYLAVMERAPAVGTVWVWSVVEMRLAWAISSLAICGGFLWWYGLSVF